MIQKIHLNHLRILKEMTFYPSQSFNIISGENGAGKTSFLEAIYLLSFGRSFRTTQLDKLITEGENWLSVFADYSDGNQASIKKERGESIQLQLNAQKVASSSEINHIFPVAVINTHCFHLLELGPQERRKFLDWGVFHMEHSFLEYWREAQKCLRQRNFALKHRFPEEQIRIWDEPLIHCAEKIECYRREYLDQYLPILNSILYPTCKMPIEVEYFSGWDPLLGLRNALNKNFYREQKIGYTLSGPHRADLQFRTEGKECLDFLSRGQQKRVIYCAKIAQGILLSQERNKKVTYLLDDIAAELDEPGMYELLSLILKQDTQTFITCLEKRFIERFTKTHTIETMNIPLKGD